MNKEESAYGKGFVIRIVLLMGVLGLIVGGYYYDQQVLIPGAETRVNNVMRMQEFANKKTPDADRLSRTDVQELIGNWASRSTREYTQTPPEDLKDDKEFMDSFEPKTFQIETYKFKRIVPGLDTQIVEIAYIDDLAMFSQSGSPIKDSQLDWGFDKPKEDEPDNEDKGSENESEF